MPDTFDTSKQGTTPEPEKKEDDDRRVAGFWWWLASLLAVTLVAGGATYAYFLIVKGQQQAKTPAVAVQQPQHAAREKVESAYFYRIDGRDAQGRAASFDFIILTGDYTWALGSTSEVVSHDASVPEEEVAGRILSPKIRASLESASDLVAVGLASLEGEREREEARALARSQTILGWLAKVSNPGVPLWTLNLGQYNKGCKSQEDEDTSMERPLILTGVREKAEGANLQEALANAISGHDNLPSRDCYSRFDLVKVR